VVVALVWVAFCGVIGISGILAKLDPVETVGECWDRLARWPDGRAFEPSDFYLNDTDKYIGTYAERTALSHWRDAVLQKLSDCQATRPVTVTERAGQVINVMIYHDHFFRHEMLWAMLLPPLVLLGFGGIFAWVVGWVISGFRPRT
jgi:hypothetical protein